MTVPSPEGQRIQPALPAAAMKTYQVISPPRPASCEEVNCQDWLRGWVTTVDERTDLGQKQAFYFRNGYVPGIGQGRRLGFSERHTEAGLTEFTFWPGQRCFGGHMLPAEGAERFFERGGDFRGNPRGEVREHVRADDWIDSFATHQQRLADRLEKG